MPSTFAIVDDLPTFQYISAACCLNDVDLLLFCLHKQSLRKDEVVVRRRRNLINQLTLIAGLNGCCLLLLLLLFNVFHDNAIVFRLVLIISLSEGLTLPEKARLLAISISC